VTSRLTLVLSATALGVALLGSTPLGHAVSSVDPVVKRAKVANYAINAGAVDGIKASKLPIAGRLVALGPDGKFPASIGMAGPQGPAGSPGPQGKTGPQGPPGVSSYSVVTNTTTGYANNLSASVSCPSGTDAFGGGGNVLSGITYYGPFLYSSYPTNGGWYVSYSMGIAGNYNLTVEVYAMCAKVSS
jgi:hypothetical protein